MLHSSHDLHEEHSHEWLLVSDHATLYKPEQVSPSGILVDNIPYALNLTIYWDSEKLCTLGFANILVQASLVQMFTHLVLFVEELHLCFPFKKF